jgi:predicted DNA-binding transcriptional regulator AlpA
MTAPAALLDAGFVARPDRQGRAVTRFPELAGLAEVAGLAGVSRKRAWQLSQHPQFPQPVQTLAMGPVWRESDVVAFLSADRKPGRSRKEVKQ